jgi:4-hydroxyphenylacetate 3-monooxygenase
VTVVDGSQAITGERESSRWLRTGSQYKESLRDGREVWIGGRKVEDVTAEPSLAEGIEMIAEMFDAQFDAEKQGVLTCEDQDTGDRFSRAWQVPRTREDLAARRSLIEYTSRMTAGSYGRPPDFAPLIAVGLLAQEPVFRGASSPLMPTDTDFAANISRYIEFGRTHNVIGAEILADPQADRSSTPADAPGLLRVVSSDESGIVIRGAKSVGSLAAQGDEVIFTNLLRQDLPAEACLWAALPVATEGLKLVCREPVSHPGADPFDHPMARVGEEADQLLIYDNVFVPANRIFNVGEPELLKLYGPVTVWAHWHILSRLAVKAAIFVGVGQMVVEMLGTQAFPQVRAFMSELIEYHQTLRAFVLAAEQLAQPTEAGVLAPDVNMLTAGRVYSIENYPKVIHILQELCGQGLVMRFTRADFDNPEIGPLLDSILPARGVSARQKNQIMNFIWDLTTDSHAGRTELFENVNATPANFIRERLYREFPRADYIAMAKDLAGL